MLQPTQVSSGNTSPATSTAGILFAPPSQNQQQPQLQLLLLQILAQLKGLDNDQDNCRHLQTELRQATQKHQKELQRWADVEKELTNEIHILRQQRQDFVNLLEEQRQSRDELRQSREIILQMQRGMDLQRKKIEEESYDFQNERWNKSLNLTERFINIVEEKLKGQQQNMKDNENWKTKAIALQKQLEEEKSRVLRLESEQSCNDTKRFNKTGSTTVIGAETQDKILRYCEKCDINAVLFKAVQANNAEVTLTLLKNGVNANTFDTGGRTPLIWAAEKGDVEVGEVLLKNGANTEAIVKSDVSKRALHYAAQYGHLEFCRLLLDYGADLESLEGHLQNVVFWAGWFGKLDVVKFLVERGANIKIRNGANRNVRENSLVNGQHAVSQWLSTVE